MAVEITVYDKLAFLKLGSSAIYNASPRSESVDTAKYDIFITALCMMINFQLQL